MSVIHVFLDADPDQAGSIPPIELAEGTTVELATGTEVNIGTLPAGSIAATTAKTADYNTDVGTDVVPMQGIALPSAAGAVAGGTATAPLRTDPTGTTTQPVSSAQLPSSLGTKTAANSASVVLASDQPSIGVIASKLELKASGIQKITGNSASNTIIGPRRFEVESTNLRLSQPTTNLDTGANGVIGGSGPPNTGLRHHIFRPLAFSIPTGATLISAVMKMYDQNSSNSNNMYSANGSGPLKLYRILAANSGWDPSIATWNHLNPSTPQTWAGGTGTTGGLQSLGTDVSATPLASEDYNLYSGSSVPYWLTLDLDLAELALMATDNDGFLARMTTIGQAVTSSITFTTEEDPDPTLWPYLLVNYLPPELEGVDPDYVQRVYMQAEGGNVRWANETSVEATGGYLLEDGDSVTVYLNRNGEPTLSVYVPTGATLTYEFLGPQ